MSRFKAFRIHNDSGRIAAGFEDITLDDLAPGDVVIKVQYSSINYKDALAATGAGKILRFAVVRRWRAACDELARTFDSALFTYLRGIMGRDPW
jgi:hypothetical protein